MLYIKRSKIRNSIEDVKLIKEFLKGNKNNGSKVQKSESNLILSLLATEAAGLAVVVACW